MNVGFIQLSKAPYGEPVLFQKKKDGSMHMCVNYCALNKVTIKNKYPVPNIVDLFDCLGRASYFTKLNLRSRYWQVRITKGDEAKTTCVTRYESYKFLVMSFSLINALATFYNLMNDILYEYLNYFMVVYLDDIVVHNESLADHFYHFRLVLSWLREHRLFFKKKKREFCHWEVMFLGHWLSQDKIWMNERKVEAIFDWPALTKMTKL